MKRQHILAIVLAAVLSVSSFAAGTAANQLVEATLVNDIAFNVDGEAWSPKDVDGSPLTPLIYNGRTYVPVRSLLEDKGVTVGFDDKTRTVLLDYSTLIDKSTPLLFRASGSGAGKAVFSELTLTKNPDFRPSNLNFEQQYTFELTDKTLLTADGKTLNLADAAKNKWSAGLESARFILDENTGEVKSVVLTTTGGEDDDGQALKVTVTVEISWPPFKIKITIKW